jgi:hypothetical protein
MEFDLVIDELSINEQRGHASRRWLPRPDPVPQSTLKGWDRGPYRLHELRQWVRVVGSIVLVVHEVPDEDNARFVATMNGDAVMREDGSFQFSTPAEAAGAALQLAVREAT